MAAPHDVRSNHYQETPCDLAYPTKYTPTTWLTLYNLKTQLTGGNQGEHVALHMQQPYIFQNKNGFPTIQDKYHGLAWLGLGGLGLGGLCMLLCFHAAMFLLNPTSQHAPVC